MIDILGIGDADVDIMIKVPHIPGHDEKVRGEERGKYPGGIIANFCCAAAAFGVKTAAMCSVGDDEYGRLAISDLRQRGVDTSHMIIKKGMSTYYSVVHLDDSGEKALTVVVTDALMPAADEIDIDFARSCRRVHMTTLDMDLAEYVVGNLKGSGVLVSLDIEPTCSDRSTESWEKILPGIDIAFPNEAGLRAVMREEDVETAAEKMRAMGARIVVVTRGVDGADIFGPDGYRYHQEAYPVKTIDTTGAGDCFNAVFLGSLTKGWPLEKAAKYAAAAAALSVTRIGAREGQPGTEEIERLIRGEQ